jgi:hypothetical protein
VFLNHKVLWSFALLLTMDFLPSLVQAAGNPKAADHPLCKHISAGKIQASSGAQMF